MERESLSELVQRSEEIHPRLAEALREKFPNGFVFTVPKMHEFLKVAISEGAHLQTPPHTSEDNWIRNRNIAGSFFLTGASQSDLGKIYGLSRERISKIIAEVTADIWLNCTPQTTPLFPFEELPKGNEAKKVPEEYGLLIEDGAGNRLVEMLEKGKTPSEILSQVPSREHSLVIKQLHTLRDLGIEVPWILNTPREGTWFASRLQDSSLTDEQIQRLLGQVTRRFYQVQSQGENSVLIPVKSLVMGGGFHLPNPQLKNFIQALKDSQIPVGQLTYEVKSGPQKGQHVCHFIARIHKERALNALNNATELHPFLQNPVSQICGPKVRLPTLLEMSKSKGIRAVGALLREMGINPARPFGLSQAELFPPDFPIPIFKHTPRSSKEKVSSIYYYPLEQEDALRSYFLQKLYNANLT